MRAIIYIFMVPSVACIVWFLMFHIYQAVFHSFLISEDIHLKWQQQLWQLGHSRFWRGWREGGMGNMGMEGLWPVLLVRVTWGSFLFRTPGLIWWPWRRYQDSHRHGRGGGGRKQRIWQQQLRRVYCRCMTFPPTEVEIKLFRGISRKKRSVMPPGAVERGRRGGLGSIERSHRSIRKCKCGLRCRWWWWS